LSFLQIIIFDFIIDDIRLSRLNRHRLNRLIEKNFEAFFAQFQMTLCAPKHISLFFHFLREIIAFNIEAKNKDVFRGEIEASQSYFVFKQKSVDKITRCNL